MSRHTIRALRIYARGDLRLEELPARRQQPDEAIVRLEYGGICGSDIHYWRDCAGAGLAHRHGRADGDGVTAAGR